MTSIKAKLFRGFSFLFVVVLLLAVLGVYFLRSSTQASQTVLTDNYETLVFTHEMIEALDEGLSDSLTEAQFEQNLKKQEHNITEWGEDQLTRQLRRNFEAIKQIPADTTQGQSLLHRQTLKAQIVTSVQRINALNLSAIRRKAEKATATAERGILILSLLGTLCVLVTFSFTVNYPGYIANPLQQLTESIEEITKRNYETRLQFESSDELGQLAVAFNRMAEKLDEYEHSNLAQVISEKSRLETLIHQMQDAVIGLDDHQHILFVNEVALQLLHLNRSDVVGRYAPDVALRNDLLRSLLNDELSNGEIAIYAEGRESFFTKEQVEVVHNGSILGYLIVLKNITTFHDLNEAKTNFIATISHELKTPISSIKLSIKLLEDERIGLLNPEQQQLLRNISDDARRLLNITSELLDATQAETGRIQLSICPTSVTQMLAVAQETVRFQAEQKHISFQTDYTHPDLYLMADAEKTAWVLVNFLSNALRYSPEYATIYIQVSANATSVRMSVSDQGKGIEAGYLKRIFERYFQVPTQTNEVGGSGLGLSIARHFIEAQGGRIWAESPGLGQGSTFSFELPAAPAPSN